MASIKGYYIKPQAEEVVIAALVGALVGVTVTSLLTAGAGGYLPHDAVGIVSWGRLLLFWLGLLSGAATGGWYGITQEQDTHVKGSRYYRDPTLARKALQAMQNDAMSEAQKRHEVRGVVIGGVEIARPIEVAHIYISGVTRSGKTTIIRSVVRQALQRGDRLLLHDHKGDFIDAYYDPADSVALGPWWPRAHVWDAAADIADPTLADEFAAMLFDTKNSNLKDPHWYIAAAHVLGGLIKAHMRDGTAWTWESLQGELSGDPIALVQRAARGDGTVRQHFATVFPPAGSAKEPTLIPEQASILSTMADKIGWIANYAAVEAAAGAERRFSFARWLRGEAHQNVRKVFLNYSSRNSAVAEQIFGGMLATVAAVLEDPSAGGDRAPDEPDALWVVLDEFAQLGPAALQASQSMSELGGSRGVRVVIATQTPDQISARMGAEKSKPVLEQQATRIYTQSAPEAAETIVRLAGEHEIQRIQTTAEAGAIAGKTKTVMKEKVITSGDVTGLHVIQPIGIECILHTAGVLGKLVQEFGEKLPSQGISKERSRVWAMGALPKDEPVALGDGADGTAGDADGWAGGGSAGTNDEPGADDADGDADDTYNEDANE